MNKPVPAAKTIKAATVVKDIQIFFDIDTLPSSNSWSFNLKTPAADGLWQKITFLMQYSLKKVRVVSFVFRDVNSWIYFLGLPKDPNPTL
jgi:hypothetical protein